MSPEELCNLCSKPLLGEDRKILPDPQLNGWCHADCLAVWIEKEINYLTSDRVA